MLPSRLFFYPARLWHLATTARKLLNLLMRRYPLHRPEHVGMFAGSLLQRDDWDH